MLIISPRFRKGRVKGEGRRWLVMMMRDESRPHTQGGESLPNDTKERLDHPHLPANTISTHKRRYSMAHLRFIMYLQSNRVARFLSDW